MKRLFDLILSVIVLLILAIPMLVIALAVFSTSRGSIIYWSNRVGQDNVNFLMPKFRTMREDTPAVATHLMNDAETYLTSIGGFLRSSSLDETPQIFSILKGDMSFVGPRPALFNQENLIIVIGGDGFMLQTLKKNIDLKKKFYGINSGSYGFLMNKFSSKNIIKNLSKANTVTISPLET